MGLSPIELLTFFAIQAGRPKTETEVASILEFTISYNPFLSFKAIIERRLSEVGESEELSRTRLNKRAGIRRHLSNKNSW